MRSRHNARAGAFRIMMWSCLGWLGDITCRGFSGSLAVSRTGGFNRVEELNDVDRLGQIRAGAGRHQSFDLPGSGVGTDHYNWYTPGCIVPLQFCKYLPAGHIWKMQIEQNEIRRMLSREIERKAALHGCDQRNLRLFGQHLFDKSQ